MHVITKYARYSLIKYILQTDKQLKIISIHFYLPLSFKMSFKCRVEKFHNHTIKKKMAQVFWNRRP